LIPTLLDLETEPGRSWRGANMTHLSRSSALQLSQCLIVVLLALSVCGFAVSQTRKAPATREEEPVFSDYREVKIGWLADDVRKKLGSPADKGEEQDFYVFNEKETAQILYDKVTRKVTAISVDFSSGASGIITPQQVFGADIEAKPDGSKYKLVRYPKAGFWISYSRTAGDTPIVTVTIQKMVP
jgi:outer membrane protein assembly factor BamE (lipoprotein component of BamABCDE complex)